MLLYMSYAGVQKLKKRSAKKKALEISDGSSSAAPEPEFRVEEPLSLPVAVPQIHRGFGVPFTRAFSPALLPYGISEVEFLQFIDNLSIQASPNPGMQAVQAVSQVIAFVPYHWAIITGTVMSISTAVGSRLLAKKTTADYMDNMNATFFAPRKLKASLCKGDELARRIGMPEDSPLILPMSDLNITGQERRLAAVQPWVSPLTMGVESPAEQTWYTMSKLSAKQVAWKLKRKEKKTAKQKENFHKNAGMLYTLKEEGEEVEITEAQELELDEETLAEVISSSEEDLSDSEEESSTKSEHANTESQHETPSDAEGTSALLRNRNTEEVTRGRSVNGTTGNDNELTLEPEMPGPQISKEAAKKEAKEAKKALKELKKAKKVMWILIERLEESDDVNALHDSRVNAPDQLLDSSINSPDELRDSSVFNNSDVFHDSSVKKSDVSTSNAGFS